MINSTLSCTFLKNEDLVGSLGNFFFTYRTEPDFQNNTVLIQIVFPKITGGDSYSVQYYGHILNTDSYFDPEKVRI